MTSGHYKRNSRSQWRPSHWYDLPLHAHHMGSGTISRGLGLCPHATHLQRSGQRRTFVYILLRYIPTQHPHKTLWGPIKIRLCKFTELNDTLTPSQQGSRITRQTHDAIYALIATMQQRSPYGFARYCCFIDFGTAYPSVHGKRLVALTLKNYKIMAPTEREFLKCHEFGFSMLS